MYLRQRTRRRTFLFVIWQSGGGTQPEIGLGRMLSARGHSVRILAPRAHRERVEAAGCDWRPLPEAADFVPSKGRALEDQEEWLVEMLLGVMPAEALLAEVERARPDVLVVDYQLRGALSAAERTGVPCVAIAHTAYRFHSVVVDPESARKAVALLNRTRSQLGVPLLDKSGQVTSSNATMRRCARVLAVMPSEFDPWDEPLSHVVHVGPIFEEATNIAWDAPWAAEDPRPLVVVSLSSQYMHQEDLLHRIVAGVDALPVRCLVLTGLELAPDEIHLPASVVVRNYIPHLAVLPHASLVITHGGMGTIMAAFACGVPLVCIPLGRDQTVNGQQVQNLGSGLTLPTDALPEEIGTAASQVLSSRDLSVGARRIAEVTATYRRGEIAVEEIESLGSRSLPSALR